MANSVAMTCNCKSPAQDSLYGHGVRLHNICVKGARCTVCGNVRPLSSAPAETTAPIKAKKKK